MSLVALLTYVLFILLMQSVNGDQFSNFTFLLSLFPTAATPAMFATDIISLTSKYASLYN